VRQLAHWDGAFLAMRRRGGWSQHAVGYRWVAVLSAQYCSLARRGGPRHD
jgi:hypothetical protein